MGQPDSIPGQELLNALYDTTYEVKGDKKPQEVRYSSDMRAPPSQNPFATYNQENHPTNSA